MRTNAYDILGVPSIASADEIKRAYKRLALKYHPDVCKEPGAHDKMIAINLAYDAIREGRGRFWTPPIEQRAPERAPRQSLEEMIAFANAHEVDDDYLIMIIVGGRDKYSRMSFDELVDRVGHIVAERVSDAIGYSAPHYHKRLVGTALRWHLRGLKMDVAIRKAYVDDRYYREEARKAR